MNSTISELPPLPQYELRPVPSLIPGIEDAYLSLALPIIAYWGISMIFHLIDEYDLFPQYRLHTPAEVLSRNHVSRYEVLRDVILQQIIQTIFGLLLAWSEEQEMTGREEYDVRVWATRIRIAERAIPSLLAVLGINAASLADQIAGKRPFSAGVLRGGYYPGLVQTVTLNGTKMSAPAFAPWEIFVANGIYWALIPTLKFIFAIFVVDTWQYFWHRAMHLNKWLYTTLHSRHHRLYVPYAYGALYNHPVEGFLLDTLGAIVAYLLAGLNSRSAMLFFTFSTIKTVDDHCGYALPWDPLQLVTGNNAGYHDVHHQSWGIKTNFSQPFFTFWDRFMGTMWTGGDVSARYERARIAAEKKVATANAAGKSPAGADDSEPDPITAGLAEKPLSATNGTANGKANGSAEHAEEDSDAQLLRRSPRKKASPSSAEGSLKGLKDRVSAVHGVGGGVIVN